MPLITEIVNGQVKLEHITLADKKNGRRYRTSNIEGHRRHLVPYDSGLLNIIDI